MNNRELDELDELEFDEDEREGGPDELELIVRQMEKHLRAASASAARIRDLIEEL